MSPTIQRALSRTLSVPADASRRQVRIDGAIASACGLVMMVAFGTAPMLVHWLGLGDVLGEVVLSVSLLGYGLFVIGSYRAVTGRHPAEERYTYASSLGRIFTAIAIVIVSMATLCGLIILAAYALGAK